jgi:hypothetical protein
MIAEADRKSVGGSAGALVSGLTVAIKIIAACAHKYWARGLFS